MYVKANVSSLTIHIQSEKRDAMDMLKEIKNKFRKFSDVRLDAMEEECSIPLMTAIKKDGKWRNY